MDNTAIVNTMNIKIAVLLIKQINSLNLNPLSENTNSDK